MHAGWRPLATRLQARRRMRQPPVSATALSRANVVRMPASRSASRSVTAGGQAGHQPGDAPEGSDQLERLGDSQALVHRLGPVPRGRRTRGPAPARTRSPRRWSTSGFGPAGHGLRTGRPATGQWRRPATRPARSPGSDRPLTSLTMAQSRGCYDEDAAEAALATGARYVALVASERRAATVPARVPGGGPGPGSRPDGLDLGDLPHWRSPWPSWPSSWPRRPAQAGGGRAGRAGDGGRPGVRHDGRARHRQ